MNPSAEIQELHLSLNADLLELRKSVLNLARRVTPPEDVLTYDPTKVEETILKGSDTFLESKDPRYLTTLSMIRKIRQLTPWLMRNDLSLAFYFFEDRPQLVEVELNEDGAVYVDEDQLGELDSVNYRTVLDALLPYLK